MIASQILLDLLSIGFLFYYLMFNLSDIVVFYFQAQRLHQSQELESQPTEMDIVSVINIFPPNLWEEVPLTSSESNLGLSLSIIVLQVL